MTSLDNVVPFAPEKKGGSFVALVTDVIEIREVDHEEFANMRFRVTVVEELDLGVCHLTFGHRGGGLYLLISTIEGRLLICES